MSRKEIMKQLEPTDLASYEVLFKQDEILKAVEKVADQINVDFQDLDPVFVTILNGAATFRDDLEPYVNVRHDHATIHPGSYEGTKSSGKITILEPLSRSVEGRNVVIVEDVLDTGRTLDYIRKHLYDKGAMDVKIAVLVEKVEEAREVEGVKADYIAIKGVKGWLIGHGFDVDEKFRELPDILVKKDTR